MILNSTFDCSNLRFGFGRFAIVGYPSIGRLNDARKKNLDDVNNWIQVENDKRQKEAEALRERMEREKKELQEFIGRSLKEN